MSVERSFEAWEEIHRQGQDLADRLAQGFSGLISHPPPFAWPPSTPKKSPFELDLHSADGVSAILDIGSRIGQVGAEFGAGINGMVQHFFRQLPVPFRHDNGSAIKAELESRRKDDAFERRGAVGGGELGSLGVHGLQGIPVVGEGSGDELPDEDGFDFALRASGRFRKPSGSINITTTYDSRMQGTESSLTARGDFWRIETSNGSSTSGNENAPLFLVQLGPVLFVRDTTLLLPVHLSKQHLLWYGYDRKDKAWQSLTKYLVFALTGSCLLSAPCIVLLHTEVILNLQNGLHSLCPALWSKHRRWLLMSMICLNPLACSFMDLQFPNGQLTYVAGEGLSTSAFLPVCGGLLQTQGRYPGETKCSFSYKNKRGTCVTPMVQWPDKSFSLGIAHAMAWKRSGLMMRPTVQLSVCPTFGGSNPGMRAELIHSVKEELNLIYGCSCTQHQHPSAYASLSLGRSKWNGHVGNSGAVIRVECPLSNMGRPFFSLQLNSGFEF